MKMLLQLHISEKTGRGVPTITQRYGRETYDFRENAIVVTIPFNWINVMQGHSDGNGDDQGTGTSSTLTIPKTQQRILEEIQNNPNITKHGLCKALGLGKTSIDRGISALKKTGLLRRIGSNKTGYWMIIQ